MIKTTVVIEPSGDPEDAEGADWYREFVDEVVEPACEMDKAFAKKFNPY